MKILVTGGAGFIGSHVTDTYIEAGHEVIIVDNLVTGKKENINPKATYVKADVRTDKVQDLIKKEKPDVINHHAAHINVGKSVEDPQFDADANILGLLNVMQAAVKAGSVKKIIFASTGGAMYGEQLTPFTETMPPQPLSPYGISKRAGELYLYFYWYQYGISYTALRYANVYGPRQNPHGEAGVISIFAEKLIKGEQLVINGDGLQTRDYVYVGDVAHANLLALREDIIGEINIGTAIETDVNQIYDLVTKYFETDVKAVHGPARSGEQRVSSLNYALANTKLGWRPRVVLDKGIEHTVDWYKQDFTK